jgi:23S rRNA (uracil1939-C5)-methyltransferase
MTKNQTVEAEITGYTHEGLGVARTDGPTLFVHNAAQGDRGTVRVVKAAPRVCYGIWEALSSPSPFRAEPDCPVYPRCGGCHFRHVQYEEELRAKTARVQETLRRLGGFDLPPERVLPAPERTGWRNKAVYPVQYRDGVPFAGFYRARSHTVIPTERCAQLPARADVSVQAVLAALRDGGHTGSLRHILWRTGTSGEDLLCLSSETPSLSNGEELVQALRAANPHLRSVWLDHNPLGGPGSDNRVLSGRGRLLWGQEDIPTEGGGLRFRLGPYTFWQVNHAQLANLLAVVRDYAAAASDVLDLYCGAGVLGLSLAASARSVTGVETNPHSVQAARRAAEENGVANFTARQADAADSSGLAPDTLLVDPPRKGLAPPVLDAVRRMAPRRMVYISCDPATLARDLRALADSGLAPQRYTVLDMFPRTAHVETVALLGRG